MVVPFAKFACICALSTFLQEIWLNGAGLFEAFGTVINSLAKSIFAAKMADFIFQGGMKMIKYLKDYLMENRISDEAGVRSEWVS